MIVCSGYIGSQIYDIKNWKMICSVPTFEFTQSGTIKASWEALLAWNMLNKTLKYNETDVNDVVLQLRRPKWVKKVTVRVWWTIQYFADCT